MASLASSTAQSSKIFYAINSFRLSQIYFTCEMKVLIHFLNKFYYIKILFYELRTYKNIGLRVSIEIYPIIVDIYINVTGLIL